MQTAFQPNAFQVSGFQIVASVATVATEQATGGWARIVRREQDGLRRQAEGRSKRARELIRLRAERRKRKELERQIAALEAHIAAEQNVSRETVRLKADIRAHDWLPPYAAKAVARALKTETEKAFAAAEIALRRVEQDEDEEFAVLISLALH